MIFEITDLGPGFLKIAAEKSCRPIVFVIKETIVSVVVVLAERTAGGWKVEFYILRVLADPQKARKDLIAGIKLEGFLADWQVKKSGENQLD